MTLHFTYEGDSAEVEGRVFRFSKELGRRIGASADGMLLLPRRGVGCGNPRGPSGYYGVTVGHHSVYIHRIVYELFVERVPDGMEIDHINTDIHDNRVENLRVVTKSGNMRNPITRKRNLEQLGSVRHRAFRARRRGICVEWKSNNGSTTNYKFFESVTAASEFTGVCRTDIARVCDGRRKTGKGFKFRYCEEQTKDMLGSLSRSPMSNDRTGRPTA